MLMERRAQDAGIGIDGVPSVPPVGNLETLCR